MSQRLQDLHVLQPLTHQVRHKVGNEAEVARVYADAVRTKHGRHLV